MKNKHVRDNKYEVITQWVIDGVLHTETFSKETGETDKSKRKLTEKEAKMLEDYEDLLEDE